MRFDRPKLGGGFMLFVRNCCNILCIKQFAFGAIQVLCINVEYLVTDTIVVRFVYVYTPLNTNMASSLQFLKALASDIVPINSDKLIVIMGDFNLTKIDWSIPRTVINHTTADVKLLLFAQRGGFKQFVSDPMYDKNFTDLLFISQSNSITDVNVEVPFSTSDHNSVEVHMQS